MLIYMTIYALIGVLLMLVFGVAEFWKNEGISYRGMIIDTVSFVGFWPLILILYILQ